MSKLDGLLLKPEFQIRSKILGQHLLNSFEPLRLTYWLREAKSANAEVDFVTAGGNQVTSIDRN